METPFDETHNAEPSVAPAIASDSVDVDMDALIGNMESSLQFVPKGVRKKQAGKS